MSTSKPASAAADKKTETKAATPPAAATPAATPPAAGPITAEVTITPTADGPASPAKLEGKTVKVKFKRSHPAYGYFAGDTATIKAEDFEKYSKDGDFFEKL